MKYLKGILLAVFASSTIATRCGSSYGNCPSGQCCSRKGYCGTTSAFCNAGCQIGYGNCSISTNGRCGSSYGSTLCPSGECCSKYGYCGHSSAHCDISSGCQTLFGKCNSSSVTTTTKPTTTTTTKPVSTNGRCGSSYGNTTCPSDECCSKYGYCGHSSAHCDVSSGCQSSYGKCSNSSVTTIKPTTTTTKPTTTTSKPTATVKADRCGPGIGKCHNGECCSKKGYCGTTSAFCGSGCKNGYGQCSSTSNISTDGHCGALYGTVCPDVECCSKYGYCGTSSAYCDVSSGCQKGYGTCGVINNTSTDSKFKIYDKCINSKHWALSFDNGPYQYDLDLLDLLKKKGVKATFFLNGANNMSIKTTLAKQIIQRMYNEGHVIGSHTWSHADLNIIDKDSIVTEMVSLENVLLSYIGKKPAFMRPPYGHYSANKISGVLGSIGYTAGCIWNVDTLDWDNKGDIDYALGELGKTLGKPIMSLNHSAYSGITKEKLINLVTAEIDYMVSKGYTPVTMDVCLGLKAYQ